MTDKYLRAGELRAARAGETIVGFHAADRSRIPPGLTHGNGNFFHRLASHPRVLTFARREGEGIPPSVFRWELDLVDGRVRPPI